MKEWLPARKRLEERLETARARYAQQSGKAAVTGLLKGKNVRKAWEALPLAKQRQVLRAMLRDVIIMPGKPGCRFNPDRVVLHWSQ